MMFGNGFNGIGNCFGFGNGLTYGGGGLLIMLGLTALIVTGIVLLARKTARRQNDNVVMEALKLKLATGEISEEEYLKRKTILS